MLPISIRSAMTKNSTPVDIIAVDPLWLEVLAVVVDAIVGEPIVVVSKKSHRMDNIKSIFLKGEQNVKK